MSSLGINLRQKTGLFCGLFEFLRRVEGVLRIVGFIFALEMKVLTVFLQYLPISSFEIIFLDDFFFPQTWKVFKKPL